MDELRLLEALHVDGARQGPGGDDETALAISLSGLAERQGLEIADIGCGTGASTRVLAGALDARITAIDVLPGFLRKLEAEAARAGLSDGIQTLEASMDALPFADRSLDAIWSEGAIYNLGFEKGVRAWRRFLKPGGILAVSEITWLTALRPDELHAHWRGEYPEIDSAGAKMAILERAGYAPLGYFVLGEHCWLDHYYRPMERRFASFLDAHDGAGPARAIVEGERKEIALYEEHKAHYSYGFYIARKIDD